MQHRAVAAAPEQPVAPGAIDQESPLTRIWKARDWLASLDGASDKLPSAREALAEAVDALLSDIGVRDVEETERRSLDAALAPHAAEMKGALLKALRVCHCSRGFLGLPALMEETRKLLCAAPAKGVATYLEEAYAHALLTPHPWPAVSRLATAPRSCATSHA
jgi:hypothetical protein